MAWGGRGRMLEQQQRRKRQAQAAAIVRPPSLLVFFFYVFSQIFCFDGKLPRTVSGRIPHDFFKSHGRRQIL